MMVLYGYWQQLYGTVRCYTAGGRTISSSAHVPPEWKGGMHWLQQQWSWAKKHVNGLYAWCRPRGLCWVLFTQEDIAPLTRGSVLEEESTHEHA